MVDELVIKQRLESVVQVLEAGHDKLAKQIVLGIIDEIDLKVEQFEREVEGFYGS